MEPDYIELMLALQVDWPPERLREFALNHLRESCQWALKKREALEIENKEARSKGIPYEQRRAYSEKINALDALFLKWRNRGVYYDKHPIALHDLVHPQDIPYIHTSGFERHLKSALTW